MFFSETVNIQLHSDTHFFVYHPNLHALLRNTIHKLFIQKKDKKYHIHMPIKKKTLVIILENNDITILTPNLCKMENIFRPEVFTSHVTEVLETKLQVTIKFVIYLRQILTIYPSINLVSVFQEEEA